MFIFRRCVLPAPHREDQLEVKPARAFVSCYANHPWAVQLSPNISSVWRHFRKCTHPLASKACQTPATSNRSVESSTSPVSVKIDYLLAASDSNLGLIIDTRSQRIKVYACDGLLHAEAGQVHAIKPRLKCPSTPSTCLLNIGAIAHTGPAFVPAAYDIGFTPRTRHNADFVDRILGQGSHRFFPSSHFLFTEALSHTLMALLFHTNVLRVK